MEFEERVIWESSVFWDSHLAMFSSDPGRRNKTYMEIIS